MGKNVAEPVANVATIQEPLVITATELKQNLSKYLKIAQKREILITKNGRIVNKLANMQQERWEKLMDAISQVHGYEHATDKELEEMRFEWMKEKYGC